MSLTKTAKALFHQRTQWETLWDTAYRFIAPERATIFATGARESASSIQASVFDSTAIDAAEKLVNLLMSGLLPAWAEWFRLTPGLALEGNDDAEVQQALQDSTKLIHAFLASTNFYSEMQPAMLDRVVGGTGGLEIKEHGDKLYFRCIPLSELALHEDSLGRTSTLARRTTIDIGSLLRFYEDKLPPHMLEQFKNAPTTDTKDVYALAQLQADDQWLYTLVMDGTPEIVLETQTTEYSRLVASRWSKVPGWPYGRGPGLRTLSDVRALNKLKELTLKNAALAVAGVYTVVNDGILNPYTVLIEPGARIPVATNSPNDPSILPLPTAADFNVSNFSMDELRNSIKVAFMADQFQPLGRTPMSATEVAERTRVIASDMGASLARLQSELILPILKYVTRWLQKKGQLPEFLDMDGVVAEVQFVSRLSQAQWAEDRQNISELLAFAGAVGQVDQRAGLVVDGEAAVREMAALFGTPAKMLRSVEQVTENVQAAQQAAQQAQQQGLVEGEIPQ